MAISDQDTEKRLVGRAAAEHVTDGMTIGLGTGSTVAFFAEALGRRIEDGLGVRAVATSERSAQLARQHRIPLVGLDEMTQLDLCVDGADEVAPDLSMIKGAGGALLWEKIVARASRRRICIADSTKLVPALGSAPVPVEVVSFGHTHTARSLEAVCGEPRLRRTAKGVFTTGSGNYVYDCRCGPIADPAALHARMTAIPGVIETGLFIGLVDLLITCRGGDVAQCAAPDEAWWG